jgi:hypothetical protein
MLTALKHFSKKTTLLIIGLAVLTIFFLVLAINPNLFFPSKTLVMSPTPTPTPYAQTSLVLSPIVATGSASSTISSISINIDTSINKVTAVQLELGFDPQVVKNLAVKAGSFFTSPVELIKDVNNTTGRVSYALGISPTDKPISGKGQVAILTFNLVAPLTGVTNNPTTTISVLPKSLVTAQGVTQSVLMNSYQLTIPVSAPRGIKSQ